MVKKVTIVLQDDVVKKLYEKQSKLIKESTSSVSFSKVVNKYVRQGFKKV